MMKIGKGSKSSEQVNQKKSQLEHILLHPDAYIGSIEKTNELMWVYDSTENQLVQREISFVPGLYKIFDEILVNAANNKQLDNSIHTIKIDIDAENNTISIWNNGPGIPVTKHKEEKMYVPTMIFGHLLTSPNCTDAGMKVTGGRNAYDGATLCNIFSSRFTVETATKQYKKSFRQTWGNNMSVASDPIVKEFHDTDYIRITFSPDLDKFNMATLDEDIVALMSRRAYDIAASSKGVSVFLDGNKVAVGNFKDYIHFFVKNADDDVGQTLKVIHEECGDCWEVACCPSDNGFQQVSFVNSIATTKGGRHVDHVVDNIIMQLMEGLQKKNKNGINIEPIQVRDHLWIFVNCFIENPTFDSQTKENMTLQAKSFGSKCALSEKFIANLSKAGIIESVLAKFKSQNDVARTGGKKSQKIKGVPKLEDANEAGTKNSIYCTLILTEGDSAKSLAVSGLGVIGRKYYGVFPLRDKLPNVREATPEQLTENVEINNLVKIIGLQSEKEYLTVDDLKTLRYGKLMIMTDRDHDGSHFKGLLINFIHTNWPSLLRWPFLEAFIAPIVKATKNSEVLLFYSMPEFEEWKLNTANHRTYNIKYYKGLGTSTSTEAKEYFQDMERHRIMCKYDGQVDDDRIIMAFAKEHVESRKTWLTKHMDEVKRRKEYLYAKGTQHVSYSDFINLELVLFFNAENERYIPSVVDGLKPEQRKVMFTCFKRNDEHEVRVTQLSGSVAEMSGYHHGEESLQMTIVNLAQNFVGSNNINLLEPRGQFGTRLTGGKDCANACHIFTKMSPLTRLIYHPLDDPLLSYQVDDHQSIEPTWYIPVIPMVLVNGAEGFGTGWSTKIPNYNPQDLINNLRLLIEGKVPLRLHPWYKNFTGRTDFVMYGRYVQSGKISILPDNRIEITELPVGTWTQNFKENVLEPLSNGTQKDGAVVSEYREYHTDTTVRFVISFAPGQFERLQGEKNGFHRVFKLTSSISLNQMHAFDENNCIRRFATARDILIKFYKLRLKYYFKRKDYLVGQLTAQAEQLADQARFILEKSKGKLVIENKKGADVIAELLKHGYRPDPVKEWQRRIILKEPPKSDKVEGEVEYEDTEEPAVSSKTPKEVDLRKDVTDVMNFDYLLGMSMWMLTDERKNELLWQRDTKLNELESLEKITPQHLWTHDLDNLEKKLDELEKERPEEHGVDLKQAKSTKSQKAATVATRDAQRDTKLNELDSLEKITPQHLRTHDLDNLEKKLDELEKERPEEHGVDLKQAKSTKSQKAATVATRDAQRDTKLNELDSLEKITPQHLRTHDLDKKLDELEKERPEEQGVDLKQAKSTKSQKAATVGKGKKGKVPLADNEDIFRDPIGEKVSCKITDDPIKMIQTDTKTSSVVKVGNKQAADEIDDLDGPVEQDAIKTSSKAKKAHVKKEVAEKKPRVKKGKSSADALRLGKKRNDDNPNDGDDDNVEFKIRPTRRATSKKINYFYSETDSNKGSDADEAIAVMPIKSSTKRQRVEPRRGRSKKLAPKER